MQVIKKVLALCRLVLLLIIMLMFGPTITKVSVSNFLNERYTFQVAVLTCCMALHVVLSYTCMAV